MPERVYCGKGKEVGNYGNIRIGLKQDSLQFNEKGYCNIIVSKMREADKYGNQYTVYIDDWKPNQQQQQQQQPEGMPQQEDLPF